MLIGHTRGPSLIIVEKNSFLGPNSVLCCYAGRVVRVGEGAVVAAGAVITRSGPARALVAPPPSRPVARLNVPPGLTTPIGGFLAGLGPISRPLRSEERRVGKEGRAR